MKVATLLFALLLAPAIARAQNMSAVALQIKDLSAASSPEDVNDAIGNLTGTLWQVVYLSPIDPVAAVQAEVAEILSFRRADIQTGASSGASGTTSAVLNPLLPAIFGVAFEDGAITRSVSGSTISFKVAPAGLICAAKPLNAAAVARRDDAACRTFWNRIGVLASFDTKRGEKSAKLENLQTLNNQFAGVAVRGEVLNWRKATGVRYRELFATRYATWQARAQALVDADRDAELEGAKTALTTALLALVKRPEWKGMPPEKRAEQVTAAIKETVSKVRVPEAKAAEIRGIWLSALRADRELQNAVANAPVLTAEYAFDRPDLATTAIGTVVPAGTRPPSLHTVRAIYAQGLLKTNLDFTANVSASWFGDERPGMSGSFRDIKAGFAGTFRLRDLANYGAPALSVAALYAYLHQPPLGIGLVAFNDAAINKPGHMGVFQAKLEFPTANNAMRIPLSFTYSNRTELIKESDVRGQIGISFNLDALFVDKK